MSKDSETAKLLKEATFQLAFVKSKLRKVLELTGENPVVRKEIEKIMKEL